MTQIRSNMPALVGGGEKMKMKKVQSSGYGKAMKPGMGKKSSAGSCKMKMPPKKPIKIKIG